MSYILGIDLGTKCGWAIAEEGADVKESGTWSLARGRWDGGGMRFVAFRRNLDDLLFSEGEPAQVKYESVRRHLGVDAAHVYGGLQAILTEWCERHCIPYAGVPVQSIKKFATGKGNAKKDAMKVAAEAKWGKKECAKMDDNEIDARFIVLTPVPK